MVLSFGVKKEVPDLIFLEFLGVGLCLIALFLFLFVHPEDSELKLKKKKSKSQSPLLAESNQIINYDSIDALGREEEEEDKNEESHNDDEENNIYDRINPRVKRILGVIFAVSCGLAAAFSYTPILYIQNNYPGASQDQNDYALAYNTGILFGSLLFFVVYCIINKNKPKVYPNAILPTFISGL